MTSGFVSFLKKAGEVIVDAAAIYAGIGAPFVNLIGASSPKAGAVVSTVGGDLTQIANIITQVEGTFAAVTSAPTGALKLKAAIPQVASIVQEVLGFTKDKIENPALYNQGVQEITQGVVDILNSAKASAVQTSVTPVAGSPVAPSPAVPAPLAS